MCALERAIVICSFVLLCSCFLDATTMAAFLQNLELNVRAITMEAIGRDFFSNLLPTFVKQDLFLTSSSDTVQ